MSELQILLNEEHFDQLELSNYSRSVADVILKFHKTFKEYSVTPLHRLDAMASKLGVQRIYVKDESFRFGLNAFKILGGSYAIGSWLKEHPDKKDVVFVTATDGNHGRGVAWAAKAMGCKAVVYMPKGTTKERFENIRALGADVSIEDFSYDECVRLARTNAEKYGWVIVQDTAWDGYEDIPLRIMQGYMTLSNEAASQMEDMGDIPVPSHIFAQAGVGSAAASVIAFFCALAKEKGLPMPKSIVVEPDSANCIYLSAQNRRRSFVSGEMNSIMAGLCCGEPCTIAWDILKDACGAFVSCGDEITMDGMRLLAHPCGNDPKIISGESGAVTCGMLNKLMTDDNLSEYRKALGLGSESRVLLISTEGDTDKESYNRIVGELKQTAEK